MDIEPNNTAQTASPLGFVTLTGGSVWVSNGLETLSPTLGDAVDYFSFTHSAALLEVTVSVSSFFLDSLSLGGVYGDRQKIVVTPVEYASGSALEVEMRVGMAAYGEEWSRITGIATQAMNAAYAAFAADPDDDVAYYETQYIGGALALALKIIETDGVNVDPWQLAYELEQQYVNVNIYGGQLASNVRDAMRELVALYRKWDAPLYLDATTGQEVSGTDAIWAVAGTKSVFSVEGERDIWGTIGDGDREFLAPSIRVEAKNEILTGQIPTPQDDKFTGTTGPDYWDMLGGDDTVNGGKGNDTIWGNVGDDSISGGDGDDVLDGGPGNDTLDGGAGNDTLRGDAGKDKLIGGKGNDYIDGFAGDDTVDAGAGNDIVLASSGNDAVKAGDGDDYVNGEAGKDTIDGGSGRDTVKGGAGKDSLTGGSGNDEFRYATASDSRGSSVDIITDFEKSGNDRINFADIFGGTLKFRGEKDFTKAGQVHIEDIAGPDVLVQVNLDSNKSTVELEIRLAAVSASTIKADDFIL